MRRIGTYLGACLLSTLVLLSKDVNAASPQLTAIAPRGIQVGTSVEIQLRGLRLGDTQELLFYSPGIQVQQLQPTDTLVRARLEVASHCRLGEHAVRVRTATGVSELRTFYVGPFPSEREREPNNEPGKPQKVNTNITVEGTIVGEDVDFYAISARKGQRLSAEVEGLRLGTTLFDPYVAILTGDGKELVAADDTPLLYQDSAVTTIAPKDGTYLVMVRDSAYASNGTYRLHIGNFPRPTFVYPAGGQAGREVEVSFRGDAAGEIQQTFLLPDVHNLAAREFALLAMDQGLSAPSPNVFRISSFDNVLEQEPNDTFANATPTTRNLPLAFNGILSKPGDVDCFRFHAKKGARYDVQLYGRRIRSPMDSVLSIFDSKNRQLVTNDDSGSPDSGLRLNVPADGEYTARISDQLNEGGENYVYRVEMTPVEEKITVTIPKVQRYSQERQAIAVPRGNRFAVVLNPTRADFTGDARATFVGLPQGLTYHAEPIIATATATPVLFEASSTTNLAGALAAVQFQRADNGKTLAGSFRQQAELITGNPGQSVYWGYDTERLAIAVADSVPFKIQLLEPKIPLLRDGALDLRVRVERQAGFTGAINLRMLYNPPGINSQPAIVLPANKSEVLYPLNATAQALTRGWKMAVLGQADLPGGAVWVSTQLANVEVADVLAKGEFQRAAVVQGQEGKLICTMENVTPFEGTATAEILGLPLHVTAPKVSVSKDMQQIVFSVGTTKETPVGLHRNLLCRLTLPKNGETMVQTLAQRGMLRVDPPGGRAAPGKVGPSNTKNRPVTKVKL